MRYGKINMVKIQFRGLGLYTGIGGINYEVYYLSRISETSSLNLHTFHYVCCVIKCRIYFHKHGKWPLKNQQHHHASIVDVPIMTSKCRCVAKPKARFDGRHHSPINGSWPSIVMDAIPTDDERIGRFHWQKLWKIHTKQGHTWEIASPIS